MDYMDRSTLQGCCLSATAREGNGYDKRQDERAR